MDEEILRDLEKLHDHLYDMYSNIQNMTIKNIQINLYHEAIRAHSIIARLDKHNER